MDSESLTTLTGQLGAALVQKHDVTLRISSPGGDGFATLLTIDKIIDMKVRQHSRIHCVASVMAASAAAILLESPVCDDRYATPYTVILFHGGRSGGQGKAGDMADQLDLMRDFDRAVASVVAPRLGLSVDEYLRRTDRRDWWMGAEEALRNGALDGVLPVIPPPAVKAAPPAAVPNAQPPALPPPAQIRLPAWKRLEPYRLKGIVGLSAFLLALTVLRMVLGPKKKQRRSKLSK